MLAGGVIAEYLGWRWVMFVNIPMALAAMALALRAVPRGLFGGRSGQLDVVGAILATGGVGLLILGVMRTDRYSWSSGVTIGTLAAAVVLIAGFLFWEQRGSIAAPLVRLSLLAKRNVGGANLFMLLMYAGQFGSFYFISLYLQQILKLSTAQAGLAFLPICVTLVGGIALSTKLLRRMSVKTVLLPGGLLAVVIAAIVLPGGRKTEPVGPATDVAEPVGSR